VQAQCSVLGWAFRMLRKQPRLRGLFAGAPAGALCFPSGPTQRLRIERRQSLSRSTQLTQLLAAECDGHHKKSFFPDTLSG
jgi:hypothetical protein